MWPAQTPPTVPGADQLRDLSPGVAITLLVVVAFTVFCFYFGPSIAGRVRKSTPDTEPAKLADAVVTAPTAAVAAPAVDRAAQVSDEYRDYLLDQIRKLESRVEELERENRRLREDVERYRYNPPPAPGWTR